MGNSTFKLQDVVDFARTKGELQPIIAAAGFSGMMATRVANDVLTEMLARPFAWKWNRVNLAPFVLNSWQQDYASAATNIGWLEHAAALDVNNTALPKPILWLEAVKDLERTSRQYGEPGKICWQANDQIIQAQWATWPGATSVYTNPVGANTTPANGPTQIIDAHGNVLLLTTYGTTGATAPDAGASPAIGTTVTDGTVVWTVMDPKAQGFRVAPLPPQAGRVWQIYPVAQAKPLKFASLAQAMDPIPDDYLHWFQQGYEAHLYDRSSAPEVKRQAENKKIAWYAAMKDATTQGDREKDDMGIIPASNIMESTPSAPPGPAWPFPR